MPSANTATRLRSAQTAEYCNHNRRGQWHPCPHLLSCSKIPPTGLDLLGEHHLCRDGNATINDRPLRPDAFPARLGQLDTDLDKASGRAIMTGKTRLTLRAFGATLGAAIIGLAVTVGAMAAEPIRIGFGMALTGPLAPHGQSALPAQKIWEEDINAKGGLLGRPVKLVYYDDQSNPSTVPGIYTKLLDVDKVDLVVGGYATNMVAPALPVMMQKKKLFIGLLALAV